LFPRGVILAASSSDTANLQYPLRGTIRPKETPLYISAACQRSLG
jgi:hypothetical protein